MITEEAFMDIVALHRQGHSMRFIAKRLGLHRNTVKKYILGKRFPEYRRTERRVSILAPFVRIIQDWVSQDNYRASWIFDRLKQIGYTRLWLIDCLATDEKHQVRYRVDRQRAVLRDDMIKTSYSYGMSLADLRAIGVVVAAHFLERIAAKFLAEGLRQCEGQAFHQQGIVVDQQDVFAHDELAGTAVRSWLMIAPNERAGKQRRVHPIITQRRGDMALVCAIPKKCFTRPRNTRLRQVFLASLLMNFRHACTAPQAVACGARVASRRRRRSNLCRKEGIASGAMRPRNDATKYASRPVCVSARQTARRLHSPAAMRRA
jgi:hypothetical protein